MLDGQCIHKFIMPSSRTESESADFFHETDRLQDFENRNNTNTYTKMHGIVKTFVLCRCNTFLVAHIVEQ